MGLEGRKYNSKPFSLKNQGDDGAKTKLVKNCVRSRSGWELGGHSPIRSCVLDISSLISF